VQCGTPAGTRGAAKCSFNIINEVVQSRGREDKRSPPSEKTLKRKKRRLSPRQTCPAGQAGWESQPPFRQKCKKEVGGEKREDRVKQREAGSRQTLPVPEESTSADTAVESAEDAAQQGKGSS